MAGRRDDSDHDEAGRDEVLRAIGILGGTFDPVHLGHLALAREAMVALDLESVLFVPNADPPHKQDQAVTAAAHRAAMVDLAIAPEPGFELSRLELDRPGPSYAVDTMTEVARMSRAAGRPEPWFVLSAEVLDDLDSWREPLRLLELCRVAVAPRPGADTLDRDWLVRHYPEHVARFSFLPGPYLDIASSTIRRRLAAGRSIEGLVPDAVARYIDEHQLHPAGRDALKAVAGGPTT